MTVMMIMIKGILLKLRFNIWKVHMTFKLVYIFYLTESQLKKVEKFIANLHDKNEHVAHIKKIE